MTLTQKGRMPRHPPLLRPRPLLLLPLPLLLLPLLLLPLPLLPHSFGDPGRRAGVGPQMSGVSPPISEAVSRLGGAGGSGF